MLPRSFYDELVAFPDSQPSYEAVIAMIREQQSRDDQPVLEESTLSPRFDFSHSFNHLDCRLDQFSVISYRNISSLFEIDRGVLLRRALNSKDLNKGKMPTIVISFPAAFLKAFVHLTFRGFRFILYARVSKKLICMNAILLEIFMAPMN